MRKILSLALLLAACAASPRFGETGGGSTPSLPAPIVTVIPATLTPTVTSVPTSTPTVEGWMFPFTIEGLRHHEFASGKVRVGEVLEQTDDYTRYSIDYPSDSLTITGVMQVPAQGEPPFPVIVMNHGYFNRGDFLSGDGTDRAAEYLNRHGYLTLSPDYRSWGGSDAGPSLFYSGLAIDVINLLDAISSIPQADPNRVGLWGHSMGGGVTMKVLAILGGRVAPSGASGRIETTVRAAVLYSTVSADHADLITRWGLGCIGDIAEGELSLGCNSSDIVPLDLPPGLIEAYHIAAASPGLMRQISPIHHLDLVTVPVQIHYGTADGDFIGGTPPEWSRKLYDAFVEAGRDAELFAYEDERHSFVGDAWVAFMERSAHFFDKYVKNMP
ncbi:MAG: alpha/beta hydrolase family protein [Chloroflexota bacterium]